MSIDALTNLGAELTALTEAFQAKARAQGETAVKAAVAALFAEFSNLKAVRWTQYTPYFNDGEACEFSLHAMSFKADDAADHCEYGCDEDDWYDLPWTPKTDLGRRLKAFQNGLEALGDGLEHAFGDHAEVTCTVDGVTVEEYEHD